MTKRKAAGWVGFSATLVLLVVLAPRVAGFGCVVAGSAFNRLGIYKAAATTLTSAVSLNPNSARGYVELGSAYLGLKKYHEAEQAFLKAQSLHDDSCASCGLGTAYYELHRYDDAEKSFKHSVSLDSNDACPYEKSGRMYYDINKFQEAITAFKQAISLNPSYSNYMYLGNAYVYAKEFQSGVDAYRQAIGLNAQSVRARVQLAIAYDYLKRHEQAVAELQKALKLEPNNAKAHYSLIEAYLFLGNRSAALMEYEILQKIDPDYTDESFEDLALAVRRERGKEKLYFIPLNNFASADVKRLVSYYKEKSGIDVITLEPLPLRLAAIDNRRQQQVAEEIVELMKRTYPNLVADPNAVLIGLTNEDMYMRKYDDWQFAFSYWVNGRFGVVSSARMNTNNVGAAPNDEILNRRMRKMVTKAIGMLYYRLPTSNDPKSAMYEDISSVQDLDNMGDDF
jgi:tetratricopeptide (TPR) repeat protein